MTGENRHHAVSSPMIIYIAIGMLVLSTIVALKFRTIWVRAPLVLAIVVWATFLLYFNIEGIARLTSTQAANLSGFPNMFFAGIAAYKDALGDVRIALFLLVLALGVLALSSRSDKP
jgi:hypothetical protein